MRQRKAINLHEHPNWRDTTIRSRYKSLASPPNYRPTCSMFILSKLFSHLLFKRLRQKATDWHHPLRVTPTDFLNFDLFQSTCVHNARTHSTRALSLQNVVRVSLTFLCGRKIRCSALLKTPVQFPNTSSVLPTLVGRTRPTGSVATAHLHIGRAWAVTPDNRHANSFWQASSEASSCNRQSPPWSNPSPSRRAPPVPAPTKIAECARRTGRESGRVLLLGDLEELSSLRILRSANVSGPTDELFLHVFAWSTCVAPATPSTLPKLFSDSASSAFQHPTAS